MAKDFISIADFSQSELWRVLSLAKKIKKERVSNALAGRAIGLIFQKPSTRTAVSFAVGVAQLGAQPLILSADTLQIKRGESPRDTSRVLSRYLDAIVIRANRHDDVLEMAESATIPIINGLTDKEHPCQVMADLMTIMEHRRMSSPKDLKGFKLAYLGDGNNMAHSLMLAAALLGMEIRVASPVGYSPKSSYLNRAEVLSRHGKGKIFLTKDPLQAVKGADAVYTDVWTSMGQEAEVQKRKLMFGPYQVNRRVMAKANRGALVMHCLPAHRGEEITEDVLEGKNSVVFDQAENRLPAQKAILLELLQKTR